MEDRVDKKEKKEKKIAKERKVIPDPIDDRKFQQSTALWKLFLESQNIQRIILPFPKSSIISC